jgi:hypothetical protein
MSFSAMKKNRKTQIDAMVKAAEAVSGNKNNDWDKDADKYWKPTVDKSGNGYAVFRFLPAAEGEDVPWVRYWDHGFQGPGGMWYIERSLTSIGKQDPLSEMNTVLWNSGLDSDKELVRQRKRRLHYVSNIYVVSDSANPANEGKTFMYVYGKKIFDKLTEAMQPEFPDDVPVNPFDFWGGADFKLKIRKVEGYRNYDRSEFGDVSEFLGGDDVKLEGVYNSLYNLQEFNGESQYKTYDELKTKLARVLGTTVPRNTAESVELNEVVEPTTPADAPAPVEATSTDDTLSYFAKLAQEG